MDGRNISWQTCPNFYDSNNSDRLKTLFFVVTLMIAKLLRKLNYN